MKTTYTILGKTRLTAYTTFIEEGQVFDSETLARKWIDFNVKNTWLTKLIGLELTIRETVIYTHYELTTGKFLTGKFPGQPRKTKKTTTKNNTKGSK